MTTLVNVVAIALVLGLWGVRRVLPYPAKIDARPWLDLGIVLVLAGDLVFQVVAGGGWPVIAVLSVVTVLNARRAAGHWSLIDKTDRDWRDDPVHPRDVFAGTELPVDVPGLEDVCIDVRMMGDRGRRFELQVEDEFWLDHPELDPRVILAFLAAGSGIRRVVGYDDHIVGIETHGPQTAEAIVELARAAFEDVLSRRAA